MTYAHLPARSVVDACRRAKERLEERREFERDLVDVLHENIARGRLPPERATEPDPFREAAQKGLKQDEARVEGIMALARAAGEGTIAVDTGDFQVIASYYRI